MPSVATGARAANRELLMIGVSGDGDSLSIGLGQLCHAMRRNLDLVYVLENNGVYGLTKGQFSASADPGSKSKRGEPNTMEAIDGVLMALSLGASFVARSFSGDKEQLIPLLKGAIIHRGFAFLDVISPCVTFNDHEGSTKSYAYTREHKIDVVQTDFIPPRDEITAEYAPGEERRVRMHDGGWMTLRKVEEDYDPYDRVHAYNYVSERRRSGEVATGLLFIDPESRTMHEQLGTVKPALSGLPYEDLCPGAEELSKLQERFR